MWTSGGATVCVVTELVDVHATLGIWVVSSDIVADSGWRGLGFLLEGHGALDVRVTTEICDCMELSVELYSVTMTSLL